MTFIPQPVNIVTLPQPVNTATFITQSVNAVTFTTQPVNTVAFITLNVFYIAVWNPYWVKKCSFVRIKFLKENIKSLWNSDLWTVDRTNLLSSHRQKYLIGQEKNVTDIHFPFVFFKRKFKSAFTVWCCVNPFLIWISNSSSECWVQIRIYIKIINSACF